MMRIWLSLILAVTLLGGPRAQAAPGALPDLLIQSLTVEPAIPAPGQFATVSVVVKNAGAALDGPFRVYLYVDPPERPPTATTPDTGWSGQGWLAAGGTFSYVYGGATFAAPGCDHVVYAWVDRAGAVIEADETNNVARLDVCAGGAAPGDRYEPDDSCGAANVIGADGAAQTHTFAPAGDEDWLRFQAASGTQYVIATADDGPASDALLEVQTRCNLPPAFGGAKVITYTALMDGPVYVHAFNKDAAATGNAAYRVWITAGYDCSGYYEPNDGRAVAAAIRPNAAAQRHRFCRPGDEDWVRFPVRAGAAYAVSAAGRGADARPQLAAALDDEPAARAENPLLFTAPRDGTYYVRIANASADAAGPAADYDLTVSETPCVADAREGDDTRETARPVAVNADAARHTTCPADDRDWARFTAAGGVTYTLETVGLGAESDTVVCLHDATGAALACDDEGGAGHAARLTWTAPADGEVFVEIRQADARAAGEATAYDFNVVEGACRGDAYEPDGYEPGAEVPALIPGGPALARDFCGAGDRDWARLEISAAGLYTIQTGGPGPENDTVLTLYAADRITRLARNDDFALGVASRLTYRFPTAGVYYVETRHFNPAAYGRNTAYLLWAAPGPPPVDPVTPPTPLPPGPPPTPVPPSGLRTLILTNRAELTRLYGAPRTDALFERLAEFANHPAVLGEIIEVDANPTVAAAYAAWRGEPTSAAQANATADAARAVAQAILAAHPSAQYVVLVGDDRVLPMRRVADRTKKLESTYAAVSPNTTVGAALAADMYLTDDCYADAEPTPGDGGAELCVPDVAIGRLIETPEEISAGIDNFLGQPQLNLGRANTRGLVVGYDFLIDAATSLANDLLIPDLGAAMVDATLIGPGWGAGQLKQLQFNAAPAFKLQAFNGHATHVSQGAPDDSVVTSADVAAGSSDLSSAIIYSAGCHAGLNAPETSSYAFDLAQAFSRKQANYVANTGYGWGDGNAVLFSEQLSRLFTQELLRGSASRLGTALLRAKQRYVMETVTLSAYDEKAIQQFTLYGFPMLTVGSGGLLGGEVDFPSAEITSPFTPSAAANEHPERNAAQRSGVEGCLPAAILDVARPLRPFPPLHAIIH